MQGGTKVGSAEAGKAEGAGSMLDDKREAEIEIMLTNVPNPSNPPASSLAITCPRLTARTPTHNDKLEYSVSSYGSRKRTAERAKVTQANGSAIPHAYAQAMAAGWEAACNAENHAFAHMGVCFLRWMSCFMSFSKAIDWR